LRRPTNIGRTRRPVRMDLDVRQSARFRGSKKRSSKNRALTMTVNPSNLRRKYFLRAYSLRQITTQTTIRSDDSAIQGLRVTCPDRLFLHENSADSFSTFLWLKKKFFLNAIASTMSFLAVIRNTLRKKKWEQKKSRQRCLSRFDSLASNIKIGPPKLFMKSSPFSHSSPGIFF